MSNMTVAQIRSGIPREALQFLEALQEQVSRPSTIQSDFHGEEHGFDPVRELTAEELRGVLDIAQEHQLPVSISSAEFGMSCALCVHTSTLPPSPLFSMKASQLPGAKEIRGDDDYDVYQPKLTQIMLDIANTPENLAILERVGLEQPEPLSSYFY